MKIFKYLLINLCFFSVAFAETAPLKCPSIKTIRDVPLIVKYHDNFAYTMQVSKFDTSEKWTFVIKQPYTKNPEDVQTLSEKVLLSLEGTPQPTHEQHEYWGSQWYCHYHDKLGNDCFAKTNRG